MKRFSNCGLSNRFFKWLGSQWIGRSKSVKFNSCIFVPSGAQQGSHLGAGLFLLFIDL